MAVFGRASDSLGMNGKQKATQNQANGRERRRLVRCILSALALASGLLPCPLEAGTITLSASQDGTLYESATNAESNGAGPTMFVGKILQFGQYLRRGLVQFDLTGALPEGAIVEDVQLAMRLSRLAPDLAQTSLSLHKTSQSWGEGASNAGALGGLGTDATPGDVTWLSSSYPNIAWNQPGGDIASLRSASVTVSDLGPVVWSSNTQLVADVQSWIDQPSTNYGWTIVGDETQPGTAVRLDTRENLDPLARPYLQIRYSVSVPEPGTLSLLAAGLALVGIGCRRFRQIACLGGTILVVAVCGRDASAQPDLLPSIPMGNMKLRLEPVAEGLSGPAGSAFQYAPTDLVFPPDASGRMFAVTLGGVIRVGQFDSGLLPEPFLDVNGPQTSILPDSYGMTAMIFHPGFANPASPGHKKFYTLEPEKRDFGVPDFPPSLNGKEQHQTALYEYTVDDTSANVFSGSRRQVFRQDEPGTIHNMNELVFGPDGYLYVSAGDGCNEASGSGVLCSDNASYLGNSYGKILRIDPLDPTTTPDSADPPSANGAYRIAADNPFVDDPTALKEIFAYGLRNPYRVTFDRLTGDIYAGDVGQRNIESVERIVAGGNYGWNSMEGTFLYDKTAQNDLIPDADANLDGVGDWAAAHGLHEPLFQYDHQDGKSVVGGYVYRGTQFPELFGKYVFGDFRGPANLFEARLFWGDLASGELRQFEIDASGVELPDLIYAFSETDDGEILLLGGAKDGSTGLVLRLARATPYGDTNGDGRVDLADLNNVRNHFGGTGLGDANQDGAVNLQDLNAVRNHFGEVGPTPVPEPAAWQLAGICMLAGATCFCRGYRRSPTCSRRRTCS